MTKGVEQAASKLMKSAASSEDIQRMISILGPCDAYEAARRGRISGLRADTPHWHARRCVG